MATTEINAKYTLTGPDGTIAVFNDTADPNYVGVLTEITGLDSPDVRESAEDLVEFDGGVHGSFYYGRRPMTLTGIMLNPATVAERNLRQQRLSRASDAMRGDATLTWQPSGEPQQYVKVRRQQPLRVTGAWQKQFQLAVVASDPRVYSFALSTLTAATADPGASTAGRSYPHLFNRAYAAALPLGQLLVTNAGTSSTYPIVYINGPGNNPVISNFTTGQSLYLNYSLAAGEYLAVDMLNRTVYLNGTASRYGAVDFARSSWWPLLPGVNDLRIAFDTYLSGSSLRVDWRDAWL